MNGSPPQKTEAVASATRSPLELAPLFLELLRRRGPGWAARVLLRRLVLVAGWIVMLPLALLGYMLGYRRLAVHTFAVGHLASEPDCFLKECSLGRLPARRWLLLAPTGRVANPALLDVWARHLHVVRNPFACAFLEAMTWRGPMRHEVDRYINCPGRTQGVFEVYRTWGRRGPVAALAPDVEVWGARQLRALGIPDGAWFACVHVREPGFGRDFESIHGYRNADPLALLPAIAEIRSRGGWVVRMGDATMTPLPPLEGVVDYALGSAKSPRLDLYLCARARFFLGNTSGLFLISAAFGVPCALANMVPTANLAPGPDDLSIPKLLWSPADGRILTFPEVFSRGLANALHASAYTEAGVLVRENAPEEILDLVLDMLDRLDAHWGRTKPAPGEAAKAFSALLRPGDFAHGAASSVSPRFLARHSALLGASDAGRYVH
jgi:putative glycosyltransferase (TIGR04372 family)